MSVKMLSNQMVLSKGRVYYVIDSAYNSPGAFSCPFPFSSRQCAWNVKLSQL